MWMKLQFVWKIDNVWFSSTVVGINISFPSRWQYLSNFELNYFVRPLFVLTQTKNFSDVKFSILVLSSILHWICIPEIQSSRVLNFKDFGKSLTFSQNNWKHISKLLTCFIIPFCFWISILLTTAMPSNIITVSTFSIKDVKFISG